MIRRQYLLELALWLTAAAVIGRTVSLSTHAWDAGMDSSTAPVPMLAAAIPLLDADSLVAWSGQIRENNPFRLARRPAADMTLGLSPPTTTYDPPPPPKPALVLRGIVGARDGWRALLGGVPGREGSVVVRSGDTLSALRVRYVGRDTVLVGGMDTTWTLTMRQAWR